MVKNIAYPDLADTRTFHALDAARVWHLRQHGWPVHATGGSQHVIGDTTYWWHGEERGGQASHPFVIVQFTLSGWGLFEQCGVSHRIGQDEGFLAVVPSEHLYYLPEASPDWRFIWLDVWHPYAVMRLVGMRDRFGPKLSVAPDSRTMQLMLDILHRLAHGLYPDPYMLEQDVLCFVLELERSMTHSRYPAKAKEVLLQGVRDLVIARLPMTLSVDELARHYQKSRTRFSQTFKHTTGLSPAAFVDAVRLAQAAALLEGGTDKIEVIARETGYTSATQFCKAFRKKYAFTPGTYRTYFARDLAAKDAKGAKLKDTLSSPSPVV
ncbi:MAG: helix-turn-helix transcriptional regulator [Lentisphaerae bacterium]|jgi:AraC-like DNA-binding protein|nr:helix-turn-helix transcriptional regulator [Lentisphaerota bacterium]